MSKLNQKEVAKSGWGTESIPYMQVAVFVMCGGGFIGHMAAEQPADFYLDDRVPRRPYAKRAIYLAVDTLATLARVNGLDPKRLPAMPRFHNMGIF